MILCFCGVEDVLMLERTCKLLHTLTHSRPTWLSLLRALPLTRAPDTPPHRVLSSYTTSQLRQLAIRATRGFYNWRRKDGPRATREVRFEIQMPGDEEGGEELGLRGHDERAEPRMVPGGRWVVVNNCGRLEVWEIGDGDGGRGGGREVEEEMKVKVKPRRVWKDDAYRSGVEVLSFDFEARGEEEVVIAGVFLDTRNSSPIVRIFRFDGATSTGVLIMERTLPVVFLFRLAVRDDFVLVHMPYPSQIILMNWRELTTLVVDFQDPHGKKLSARAALISNDHLVAALNADSFSLIALPISKLTANGPWSSSTNYEAWPHYTYDPSEGMLVRLPNFDVDEGPWVLAMHVFSPVWDGEDAETRSTAEILLVAYGRMLGSGRKKKFLSYHARIARQTRSASRLHLPSESSSESSSNTHTLTLLSSFSAASTSLPWNPLSLSNSGRMCAIRDKLVCFTTLSEDPQPVSSSMVVTSWAAGSGGAEFGISGSGVSPGDAIVVEVDPTSASIEPWSGAVVVGTPGCVRILWFD